MLIRPAHPEEFESVGELCFEAYLAGGGLIEGPSDPYGPVLRDVAPRAAAGELLVAEIDGRIVGTATLCAYGTQFADICREGELEIRFLAVDPSAWGTGAGRELVLASEARARAAGIGVVVLSVLNTNAAAARLYERRGYERVPERDWSPDPAIALHVYRRAVGQAMTTSTSPS